MSREKQIEEMTTVIANTYLPIMQGVITVGEICLGGGDAWRISNALYNAGYRKQEWISVDERLPTWEDGKVLVFTHYGFSICERTVNSRWQGKHANWITHWMPLPEAPKVKGGAE